MGKERRKEIAAMLEAAIVERHRIAAFLRQQAKINDDLEGEIVGEKGWHAHFAQCLRNYADEIESGLV